MNKPQDRPRKPATAVALHYDGEQAPRVTAKGQGLVAEKILELAEEHGIPLHEDPDLVTLLARLELGDEIPANLYVAVAEVIAFAYMVNGKTIDREGNIRKKKS
jgi:flagellar biosynthesis protein